ncbi:MAG: hypothetical protein ACT4O2_11290 [Beijerinckiaceae bacterium]
MTRLLLLFGLAPALLGGCQTTHLVYVTDTVLGMDVAASAEGTGHMIFGYDRETFALVPRQEDAQATDPNDRFDAMSLAAVSCVYADGLEDVRFNHFIATGDSAVYVAQDAEGYARIRAAIFGKTPLPEDTAQNGGGTTDQTTKEKPSCD